MQNSKPCLPIGRELSIIIVNYRSEQYLKSCVASLYNKLKNIPDKEVIIVNNDEKEELTEIAAKFPSINIINHQKNIGFGAANNRGAGKARGKYLLFLNPDAEITDKNFIDILDKFKENQEVGVIGPRLVMESGETQWWCAGKEFNLWRLIKNNLGIIESRKIWENESEIFADWVSGAALSVRKEIFEKIGGFDEKFFMYFEDEDLCKRIRKCGHKVLYYPKIKVLHKGGKSRQSFLRQKIQFFRSLFYYVIKQAKNN